MTHIINHENIDHANYGPMGRPRHVTDDFFDHRRMLLEHVRRAIAQEKEEKRRRR